MGLNIFKITVLSAFAAMVIVLFFNACQNDPVTISGDETEEDCGTCQTMTSQLLTVEPILDEGHIEVEYEGRSGPLDILYPVGMFTDNILKQSGTVPREFFEMNKHAIQTVNLTKLPGISGNIYGVVMCGYKAEIDWKDSTPNMVFDQVYVPGCAASYSYTPVGLDNSLIHISSLMKWKTVKRGPQSTKAKYYDDYFCKEKYNYIYTVTTQNGSSATMRKNGQTEDAIIYVPKNI